MTPVAVYHDLVSIAPILLGIESIWFAVFCILVWRLDYVPVKFAPLPISRRGRIRLVLIMFAVGILYFVIPENTPQPATLTGSAVITALAFALLALEYCVAVCVSIFELRHAVRLSRQQRRQQASD